MSQEIQEQNLINSSRLKMQLISVKLDYIEITEEMYEKTLEFDSNTIDSYSITNVNKDSVDIELVRKVYLEPKVLYDIEIKMMISYRVDFENDDTVDTDKVKEEFEQRKEELLTPATTHCSVLISALTNASTHGIPMVVPPMPIFDMQETDE